MIGKFPCKGVGRVTSAVFLLLATSFASMATFDNTKPCLHTGMPWEATSTRVFGTARLGVEHGCMVTFIRGDAVWRLVQATGRNRGQGILYTLLLTTSRQWAHRDFASFRRVAASFRRVPIYP